PDNTRGNANMKFRTKLWKRGPKSFASTIPHIVLLNLDPAEKEYNVIWEYDDRSDKWTVSFEEIETKPLS
ncbi:MAG: hypothetical protein QMD78_07410, partial [Methanocellales archaeon]|nr:hypothetical protein [Methanocellales archaeon]